MKKSSNQHVVPHNGNWAIRRENSTRVTETFSTQREAINVGREIAKNQNCELVIHRSNGQIRDKDSYGNDPYPPKG